MSSGVSCSVGASLSAGYVLEIMRELSLQSDPQRMVTDFRRHTTALFGGHGSVSLSRRNLAFPEVRITRSTRWEQDLNPWKHADRLPLIRGGILADLAYAGNAEILTDIEVAPSDPAFGHIEGVRSIMALPLFDNGEALNMVIRFGEEPNMFDPTRLADAILIANLFGRATGNLLTSQRLRQAQAEIDLEMRRVAHLQRSLLPQALPRITGVDLAVSYKTAARAGGDYYDFFDLGDGRYGILIADVSGHGTPAAVVMAVLRTMLHGRCYREAAACELLALANEKLCQRAGRYDGMFVTAFYGVFDPELRTLAYSSAGHNPPLLVSAGQAARELDEAQTLPLGIDGRCPFEQSTMKLASGDTLLLYTDGITDATNLAGEMYGRDRLLSCVREDVPSAQHIVDCVTHKLLAFTGNRAQEDDQTLLALRVR